MRIAVLCNDRIALPALDQLLAAKLVAAVGMPDRISQTRLIVKDRCFKSGVPLQLFTKRNLDKDQTDWLNSYQPDVVLVKTFPFLIPAGCIKIPRYGFINFHYAPLPQWRGANPLFWMIRNRETAGGVTVHSMNETFDAGPILLKQDVALSPDSNFGIFYTQLAYAGLHLTGTLLSGLQSSSLISTEQDHSRAKWYGRPSASDLFINWDTMQAEEIKALVNACNPWNNGAATSWNGWIFGISEIMISGNQHGGEAPGTILSIDPGNGLTIACKEGKIVKAEVVYCEEGFYSGHRLAGFGLQKDARLQ